MPSSSACRPWASTRPTSVHPLEKCLREAIIFPLYDAGNMGMQRRKIWGVMSDPSFDPRAMMVQLCDGIHQRHGRDRSGLSHQPDSGGAPRSAP